jgi:hypothetical protein
MNGAGTAFASQNHNGAPTNIQVTHNTFINSGRAVSLTSWASAANMVFANNVCYSQTQESAALFGGSAGIPYDAVPHAREIRPPLRGLRRNRLSACACGD